MCDASSSRHNRRCVAEKPPVAIVVVERRRKSRGQGEKETKQGTGAELGRPTIINPGAWTHPGNPCHVGNTRLETLPRLDLDRDLRVQGTNDRDFEFRVRIAEALPVQGLKWTFSHREGFRSLSIMLQLRGKQGNLQRGADKDGSIILLASFMLQLQVPSRYQLFCM